MSIHEIIEKINTDKREIAFSKWKGRVVVFGVGLMLLGQVGLFIYVFMLFR
jgi:hypothetical protein